MTKRWLPWLIAWTTRVLGWVLLLGLATYVIWNHEGIGVRGQFARLDIPSEREAALQHLIDRAELAGRPFLSRPDPQVIVHTLWTPLTALLPIPAVLHLREDRPGHPLVDMYVPFKSNGQVGGAPVELELPQDPYCTRNPWMMPQVDLNQFLIISENVFARTFNARPPATWTWRVFRLGWPESPEVFAVRLDAEASQHPCFNVDPYAGTPTVLDLSVLTWTGGVPRLTTRESLATFTWDESCGRFVGPARDPQGRWEVIEPLPDLETEEQ